MNDNHVTCHHADQLRPRVESSDSNREHDTDNDVQDFSLDNMVSVQGIGSSTEESSADLELSSPTETTDSAPAVSGETPDLTVELPVQPSGESSDSYSSLVLKEETSSWSF